MRLAGLPGQPGGLYPDEAAEGVDAQRLLHEPGYHPLFFSSDAGREPLFAYMVAGVFRIFGESVATLRGTAAVLGVAGVLATFFALRRFGITAALAGAAWAAGALWLICISRDGMRNVLVPLVAALAMGALILWADRPTRGNAVLAGAAVSAGLWTYQPLKLMPLLALLWLWRIQRVDPSRFLALRRTAAPFGIALAAVAAPMAWVALTEPTLYFGRGAAVSPFNPQLGASGLPAHILRTLGMFTFSGDPNERHNVAGLPLLGWPLFTLALLGGWRAWRQRRDQAHALVLIAVPVFLIPPLIALEGGAPHFLRTLGLAPFLAALVGLGGAEAVEQLARWRGGRRWALAGLALLLAGLGAASADAYFSRGVAARYHPYSFDIFALAQEARSLPGTALVVDDYAALDVRFLDSGALPRLVAPGERLGNPHLYSRIVAPTRGDIAKAAGEDVAERAVPAARDPAGNPVAWSARP